MVRISWWFSLIFCVFLCILGLITGTGSFGGLNPENHLLLRSCFIPMVTSRPVLWTVFYSSASFTHTHTHTHTHKRANTHIHARTQIYYVASIIYVVTVYI